MKLHLHIVFATALVFALPAGTAGAQQKKTTPAAEAGIDPKCSKTQNQRGCTCALETGGTLNGNRWQYFNARTYGDCMTKKGWL